MNQHKTLTLQLTGTVDAHTLQFDTYHASSPMHTMLAALGMCSLITLHGICQRQRQHVVTYRAALSAQQRTTHPQILQHIQLHFVVMG
ncbi:MAG: OsmC family protein, partial [Roseiflexaceae bacterium]